MLDLAKEIVKAEKRIAALSLTADKLKAQMAVDGYEAKVREDVREATRDQLSNVEGEVATLGNQIRTFRDMQ